MKLLVLLGWTLSGLMLFTHGIEGADKQVNLDRENYAEVKEEFNYTFDKLEYPWKSMDASTINSDAKTAFRTFAPDSYFIVIPEKIGVEFDISSQVLADTARVNLLAVAPEAKFSDQTTITVHGLEWLRFNAKFKISNHSLVYSYSILAHNGYQYQLIYWKESYLLESGKEEAEAMLRKFKLIDPELVYNSEAFSQIPKYEDSQTGFSIDLTAQKWSNWPNSEVDIPQAKFTASYRNSVFFFAMPVFHEGLKPNSKDLKSAMLEQVLGMDAPAIASTKDRLIRVGDSRSLRTSFTFPGKSAEEMNYALVEIRNELNLSYCIGGFTSDASQLPLLEETLALAEFEAPEQLKIDFDSLRPEETIFQSQILNALAISMYSQSNFVTAKRYLDQSLRFSKENPVILSNYGSICFNLKDYGAVIDLYEGNEEFFEEMVIFREWYALALYKSGDREKAELHFNAVFDTGSLSETGLWGFLDMLAIDQRWDEAIALCDDYIDLTGSQNTRQWRATFYRSKGDFEKALSELISLKEEKPFELAIDYEIALTYFQDQKFSKSIEYIESIEEDLDQFAILHTLKGNAFFALKSYVKAKACFEKAVELNPLDAEAKSLLEYATLALGKGDTQVSKVAIEPVPIHPLLMEKARAAGDAIDLSGKSHVIHALFAIDHRKGVGSKTTRRFKLAIEDEKAINSYSTLRFNFDPFNEDVYLNEILVRDSDGKILSRENREDFYIIHNEQAGIVSQEKTLHVPIQGLRKACTLEYMITFNRLGSIEEIPFTREFFSHYEPAKFAAVSFAGDLDSLNYHSLDGVENYKGEDVAFWYARDIKAYKQESHQAKIESFIPFIALSDASGDWKTLSKEYLKKIEDRMVEDENVKVLAEGLVPGLKSNEEKTEAVYEYVQSEYSYKALEFGPRARIPNPASQIMENKYGDCKDLALLASLLLDALGIPSHLALINSRFDLIEDLPSMDQFDHMILYLPEYHGGRFIDCTHRHASLSLSTPVGFSDRDILVLDPGNPRIVNSGDQLESENQIYSERKVKIDGDDLNIEETLQLEGVPAAYFRFYLSSLQDHQLLASMQSLIVSFTGSEAQLQEVQHSKNPDSRNPLKLTLSYSIPNCVSKNEGSLLISKMPNIWEKYYLQVPFVKDRATPFSIKYPLRLSSTVSLVLPPSSGLVGNELPNLESYNDFHRFTFTSFFDKDSNIYRQESLVAFTPQDFPAERFQEYQQSAQKTLNQIGASVRLEFLE